MAQNTTISILFNCTDADLTFLSCDNVVFRLHTKYLEATTGSFLPPAGTFTPDKSDVVCLSETSATLELLFQFTYPKRHPSLESVDFTVLEAVAEAAEKYKVFAAMNICQTRMKESLPKHVLQVLRYASLHGYTSLIEQSVPLTIGLPLTLPEITSVLPSSLLSPWLAYYQAHLTLLQTVSKRRADIHAQTYHSCQHWPLVCARVLSAFGASVNSLKQLDDVFKVEFAHVGCCDIELKIWRKEVEAGLKKISTFEICPSTS